MQPAGLQFAGVNVLKEEFKEGTSAEIGDVYGPFETRPIWNGKGPQPMTPITDDMLNQAVSDDLGIADLKLQPQMALPWASMKECKLYNTDEDRLKGKIDFLRSQLGFLPLEMSRKWQKHGSVMNQNIKMVSYNDTVQVIPQSDNDARMAILNALVPLETEYALMANESQFRNDFKDWLEGKRPTHEYAPCAWLDDKTKKMVPLAGRDDGKNRAVLEAARSLVNVNPGFARSGILLWENVIKKARERRVRRRLAAMTPLNDEEAWVYYSIVVRKMPLEFIASHSYAKPPPEETQPPVPPTEEQVTDTTQAYELDSDFKDSYYQDFIDVDDAYDSDLNLLSLTDDQISALHASAETQMKVWRSQYYSQIPQLDPFSRAKKKAMANKFMKHKDSDTAKELVDALQREERLNAKVESLSKRQVEALRKHAEEKNEMNLKIRDLIAANADLGQQIKDVHKTMSGSNAALSNNQKALDALKTQMELEHKQRMVEVETRLQKRIDELQLSEQALQGSKAHAETLQGTVAALEQRIKDNADLTIGQQFEARRAELDAIRQQIALRDQQIASLKLTVDEEKKLRAADNARVAADLEKKYSAQMNTITGQLEQYKQAAISAQQGYQQLQEQIKKSAAAAANKKADADVDQKQLGKQVEAITQSGLNLTDTATVKKEDVPEVQKGNDAVQGMGFWGSVMGLVGSAPRMAAPAAKELYGNNNVNRTFQRLLNMAVLDNTDKKASDEARAMLKDFEDFMMSQRLTVHKDVMEYMSADNVKKRYLAMKPADGKTSGTDANEAMRSQNFGVAMAVVNLEAHAYSLGIDFPKEESYKTVEAMKAHGRHVANLIIAEINKQKNTTAVNENFLGETLRRHFDKDCKPNIYFLKKSFLTKLYS